MYPFEQRPDIFDTTVRLTPGQQQDPLAVLKEFCGDFDLSEVRTVLYQMLIVAIGSDHDDFQSGSQRKEAIHACLRVEECLEAIYLLAKEDNKQ